VIWETFKIIWHDSLGDTLPLCGAKNFNRVICFLALRFQPGLVKNPAKVPAQRPEWFYQY
jgi:hypothetical protein